MKYLSFVFLSLSMVFHCAAQQISKLFSPVLKEAPHHVDIIEYSDGNYLAYGDINYYRDSPSGALIKIDESGSRVENFSMVTTDQSVQKVFVLPSGKIVIQGPFSYVNGVATGNIALLHADGSLDLSFTVDRAIKITSFAVQSTGKILIVSNGLVRRLNVDGSIDAAFITDPSLNYVRFAVTAEGDRIYIIRNSTINRLEADGARDATFSFSAQPYTSIGPFALQPDGKLLSVTMQTMSSPPYSQTHTVQRFNQDGSLDGTFSAPGANSQITDMVLRQNGKIVITGLMNFLAGSNGNAFELNANGTFGRSLLVTDYNGMDNVYEDRNQNLFVTGGFKRVNGSLLKFIAKIKPDYIVDETFILPVARTTGTNTYLPIAIQSDAKLLVGGGFPFSGAANNSSKLVRLLPGGEMDSSFKPQIVEDVGNLTNPSVNALAVQDDDRIIVGGSSIFRTLSTNLARLLPDGQIDNSFVVGSGLTRSNGWGASVFSIKLKHSKIYVSGYFDRYDGAVCRSFVILDTNGNKIGPLYDGLPENSYFQDMEIQSDGKIIFMGSFTLSPTDTRGFIRLNADGSLDDTFQLKNLRGNPFEFDIDDQGNIWLAGNNLELTSNKILMRFSPDGVPDNTIDFGTGFTASKGSNFLSAYFVEVLSENLIAVGGIFSGYKEISSPALVILDVNGSVVAMTNEYDSTSISVAGTFEHNVFYTAGRFLKEQGQLVSSGAKVLFPIEATVTALHTEANSQSTVHVSWPGTFRGADQVIIERSTPDPFKYEVVATLPGNEQSYQADGLSEVTPYYFRITASNEFYSTVPFEGKDTTFIAPQVVLPPSEVMPESFVANWEYLPGTDSCMLQVSSDNFATFLAGHDKLILQTGSKLIEDLEAGKSYQYRVRRFKNKRASEFSDAVIANVISAIEDNPFGVRVFPNPVRDHLVISLPKNFATTSATIHSVHGEHLINYEIVNETDAELDTSVLKPGVYILTLSSGGKKHRVKLLRSE